MAGERFIFDERFAEAFLHERPRRVMGMRLRPFSYWHKVQLEYVQSRVLLGGAGLWDAWVAAKICRTVYPQNAIFSARYSALWTLAWYLCHGWRSAGRELAALGEHLHDYASPPKLWSGKGSSKERLAEAVERLGQLTDDPLAAARAAQLRAEASMDGKKRDMDDSLEQIALYTKMAGRPAEEAWNMPMGALLWYNACFMKMEGAEVPIWTPMDEAAFEAHKRKRASRLEKMAEEILAEAPHLTRDLARAQAGVRYWTQVVEAQRG